MGYTIREQILRAIGTAIGTGYPSELAQAPTRCRLEPFADAELPAVNWYPAMEVALPSPKAVKQRKLTVQFDVHVCSPPASATYPSIDGRADTVLAFLSTKLGGEEPPGGISQPFTETETRWSFDEANRERAVVSVTYEISYRTRPTNQESK